MIFPEVNARLIEEFTESFNDPLSDVELAVDTLGVDRSDVVASIVAVAAPGYCCPRSTQGQRLEELTLWYRQLRGECSFRYGRLKGEQPDMPREVINNDPELFLFNALRRGVRQAVVREQSWFVRYNRPVSAEVQS